jgi:hypothetical protein
MVGRRNDLRRATGMGEYVMEAESVIALLDVL